MATANREQGTGSREQELGFVIPNEVTILSLCQQEASQLCWYKRHANRFISGRHGSRPPHNIINRFFHIENCCMLEENMKNEYELRLQIISWQGDGGAVNK